MYLVSVACEAPGGPATHRLLCFLATHDLTRRHLTVEGEAARREVRSRIISADSERAASLHWPDMFFRRVPRRFLLSPGCLPMGHGGFVRADE
eukprot:4746630-Amphidinium_carterae.1